MPNNSSPSSSAATARFRRRLEDHRKQAGGAGKIALPDRVTGMVCKAGCRTRDTSGRAASQCARASPDARPRAGAAPSCAGRAAPERHPPARRTWRSVEGFAQRRQPGRIGRDEAEQQIGMAGEIFGAGLDREIDAALMRREEQRRRPGVVHDDADAARVRDLGDGRNVLHFEALRARRLDQHGAGVRPHQRVDRRRRSSGS